MRDHIFMTNGVVFQDRRVVFQDRFYGISPPAYIPQSAVVKCTVTQYQTRLQSCCCVVTMVILSQHSWRCCDGEYGASPHAPNSLLTGQRQVLHHTAAVEHLNAEIIQDQVKHVIYMYLKNLPILFHWSDHVINLLTA